MSTILEPRMTAREWARMLAAPIKDKSYLSTQLGGDVAEYLSWAENEGFEDGWHRGYDDAAPCDDCGDTYCDCPDTPKSRERQRRIEDSLIRDRYYALRGTLRGAGRKRVPA